MFHKEVLPETRFFVFNSVVLFHIFRDKSRNSAQITCRVCMEEYQSVINFLSEPIDVYNDWVDACETAN